MLIHGTDGMEVLVHYKGQRGEGIYPVAFEGLIKNSERRYRETGSDTMKQEYESFMRITPCRACHGQRLKATSLAVTICDNRTSAWIFDRKRDGDQDRTDYTDRKTERFFGRGDQGKDKGDVCIR
mgnify:CR=1 FL=1